MVTPRNPSARSQPRPRGTDDLGGSAWLVGALSVPMLAGAVALALTRRGGGIVFLILFASCTVIMSLVMAGISYIHRK